MGVTTNNIPLLIGVGNQGSSPVAPGASSRLFLDDAREHYARQVTGGKYRRKARIRATELGERAGMLGAAALARDAVLA